MPGWPQGRVRAWDIYAGALPIELIANILGVEKTAKSRALGNTYILEICLIAAESVSPPPRSTPLSKVKLRFKNSFPLSPSLPSLPLASAEQERQPFWKLPSPSWQARGQAGGPGPAASLLARGSSITVRGEARLRLRGQNTQWRLVHQIEPGSKRSPEFVKPFHPR